MRAHEAHCWEKGCQGEEGIVEFMMGTYEEPKGGELIVFRSECGFIPEKTEGIQTIGNAEAGQRFREEFQRIVMTANSQGSAFIEFRFPDIVACAAEALERVKAWDPQMEVARWRECMSIDRTGVHIWSLGWATDPTNNGPGFTQVTPQQGDVGITAEMLRKRSATVQRLVALFSRLLRCHRARQPLVHASGATEAGTDPSARLGLSIIVSSVVAAPFDTNRRADYTYRLRRQQETH